MLPYNPSVPFFDSNASHLYPQLPQTPSFPFLNDLQQLQFNALLHNVPSPMAPQLWSQRPLDSTQAELLNKLMNWKYQNYLKDQMMTLHVWRMLEARDQIKHNPKVQFTDDQKKIQKDSAKIVENLLNQPVPQPCDPNKSVKAHLKDIMYYILNNFGTLNVEELLMEKLKYRNDKELCVVFDTLLDRYASIVKTRDDMARCLLKKVVKRMKQKMRRENTKSVTNEDNARKRNFKIFFDEMSGKMEDDLEEEDEDSEKFLPSFKRGSKDVRIITGNTISSFSHDELYQGFQEYVENLDYNLDLDNNKKIDRFVKYIEGLMKKNAVKEIKKYKRIPWLKTWIESTKKIAYELANNNQPEGERKIVKKEENISDIDDNDDCDETQSPKVEESLI